MRTRISILLTLFFAVSVHAQGPSADWKTIETAHFRVHHPREYAPWAERAASRLESIREAVAREVGFTPEQKIDVVVTNPIAQANGAAWPLLDAPRILLYAEAPGPEEQIGAYGHWIDLVAVHEVAHVLHMLRPSRNPTQRAIEKLLLPLNPITLRGPRWVLEGYATVVEGRLTGAGRPSSTMRAVILRKWAESGRLPTYDQLNSDQRFLGMSMAYLMGSAYLEWLEQRAGEGSLRNLWARMTARQKRSFDAAFRGVFGDSPERLYGRFTAELTANAMTVAAAGELREGELWQETLRGSGDPAVSPDGSQLAVVLRPRNKPEKLVVWSTGPAEEEEKKYREQIEKMLARDPQDVAPVLTKPLPRKALHELTMPDGGSILAPRWTRDGRALVFSHRMPDREGFLHWDLFRWTPGKDAPVRITTLADVREADPIDATHAVAIRSRNGAVQLVRVDMTSGSIEELTPASIDAVYSHPRARGDRIAYVVHRGGRWHIELLGGTTVPLPVRTDASEVEWLDDNALVATLSSRGFAELHRIALDGTTTPLTRSTGGAFSPAPSPDGRLFFMSLEPDGFVVRVLSGETPVLAERVFDRPLVPALPPDAPSVAPFAVETLPEAHDYGIGRQESGWFTGQTVASDHQSFEAGVRIGDLIGRLDTLIVGAIGRDDAPRGAAIASAWRGWPVEVMAHAFAASERCIGVADQPCGERADLRGLELRTRYAHRFPLSSLTLEAGALGGDSRDVVFGSAAFATRQVRGENVLEQSLRLEVDGGDGTHVRTVASLGFGSRSFRIAARYQHDAVTDGQLSVGGLTSSILPNAAYALRILDPALPLGAMIGDRYDGWRFQARVPGVPFTIFYQRHAVNRSELALAGLELALLSGPQPILRFPALDLTLGAARIFDEPFRDDTRYWLSMRWRP